MEHAARLAQLLTGERNEYRGAGRGQGPSHRRQGISQGQRSVQSLDLHVGQGFGHARLAIHRGLHLAHDLRQPLGSVGGYVDDHERVHEPVTVMLQVTAQFAGLPHAFLQIVRQ